MAPADRRALRSVLRAEACLLIAIAPETCAEIDRPNPSAGPTQVEAAAFVIDVDAIDSVNQSFNASIFIECRWIDPRLAHGEPGGRTHALSEIWHPRLQLVNRQLVWPTFPDLATVSPEGRVTLKQRLWGAFSQPLRLHDYPFDRQTLRIHLVAALYSPDEVVFVDHPDRRSGMGEELSLADWKVADWRAAPEVYLPASDQEPMAGFVLEFEVRRAVGHYLAKVVSPLVMIVAMSWVIFWIDPQMAGTQIGVSTTSMLTLIAYRFSVGESLPRIPYLTRIDVFILGSTMIVFAGLVVVVVTSSLAKTGRLEQARAIDRWCRWIFPSLLGLVALGSLVW